MDYSLPATWNKITESYFIWNGRTTTRFLLPIIRMIFSLPDGVNWVLFSAYIMFILLLLLIVVVKIICGSIKNGGKEPTAVFLTAVLLFYIPSYSYAYMTRLTMYAIANIYVVSVFLYLLFYEMLRKIYGKSGNDKPTIRQLIGMNVLGFLAGLSHEAYGVIFGMVLFAQLIRAWLENHKKISVRYLFLYVGYVVGFCICFFAPGNFNRINQSHEAELHTVPLINRLINSVSVHMFVAYKIWILPVLVVPLVIVLFIILLRKKILHMRDICSVILNNLEWFLGFAISIVTWGLVTRVVIYGMLAANVMLLIGIGKALRELWGIVRERSGINEKQFGKMQNIFSGISVIAIVILGVVNYPQMAAVHQTADSWRANILESRLNGTEETIVPAYPTDLDYRFYELRTLNSQNEYDKISRCVVYGTHIVIEERVD